MYWRDLKYSETHNDIMKLPYRDQTAMLYKEAGICTMGRQVMFSCICGHLVPINCPVNSANPGHFTIISKLQVTDGFRIVIFFTNK